MTTTLNHRSPISRLLSLIPLATPTELQAAYFFYFECRRFVQWLSGVSNESVEVCAAVVAVLSPRNDWESNQLDAVALLCGGEPASNYHGRFIEYCPNNKGPSTPVYDIEPERWEDDPSFDIVDSFVNETSAVFGYGSTIRDINKALSILYTNSSILPTLNGPKTIAFYHNILHPENHYVGLPVDIHITRALFGMSCGLADANKYLGTSSKYRLAQHFAIEAADYVDMKPINLVNIIWYVVRRLKRNRQQAWLPDILDIDRWWPIYPGRPLVYRQSCHPRLLPGMQLMDGCDYRPWLFETPTGPRYGNESIYITGRDHNRKCIIVTLGRSHRFANSAGWQYRSRLVVAYELGQLPCKGEDVHHEDGWDDDNLSNLSVWAREGHGRYHSSSECVARWEDGRFKEL